ncbi:hypothetical protein [Actinoallomurus rhizosphaericola]|uniref:hypothetical protein n=1 Tax=Actinoallomurus rhizosphaericola TaxID=2952536 RepID=UPI0020939F19|nr:hypothetical protein [Actinoallomurus rhizosphaericola]MCO5998289.1 hypothetical protein [Actinoallomurus rhizosphaericola]
MAVLFALPAVAFAVLVTILYEDRLLPQTGSGPEPSADAEPARGTALASPSVATATAEETVSPSSPDMAAVPAAVEPAAVEPAGAPAPSHAARPRGRQCDVRRDAVSQGRPRIHRPVAGSAAPRVAAAQARSVREVRLEGAVSIPRH